MKAQTLPPICACVSRLQDLRIAPDLFEPWDMGVDETLKCVQPWFCYVSRLSL